MSSSAVHGTVDVVVHDIELISREGTKGQPVAVSLDAKPSPNGMPDADWTVAPAPGGLPVAVKRTRLALTSDAGVGAHGKEEATLVMRLGVVATEHSPAFQARLSELLARAATLTGYVSVALIEEAGAHMVVYIFARGGVMLPLGATGTLLWVLSSVLCYGPLLVFQMRCLHLRL